MNPRDVDAVRRAVEQASEQQKTILKASDALEAFTARQDYMTAVAEALRQRFAVDTLYGQSMKDLAANISGMYRLSEPSIVALGRLGLADNLGHLTGGLDNRLLATATSEALAAMSGKFQALNPSLLTSLGIGIDVDAFKRLGLFPDPAITGRVLAGLIDVPSLEATALTELAAKFSFQHLPWETLGERVGISARARWGLQRSTRRFERRYADLTQATSESDDETPAGFVTDAPMSVLAHGQSLRVITTESATDALVVGVRVDVVEATFEVVEARLEDVNPRWVEMLRGARERAVRRGPDWPRHWASSYRQLLKNILHAAAPSDVVKQWAKEPSDLDEKGFPKHRTKVRWLCRNKPETQRQFLVEDIDSALRVLKVLHETVHEDDTSIAESEFQWLSLRVEKAMHDILKLWQ